MKKKLKFEGTYIKNQLSDLNLFKGRHKAVRASNKRKLGMFTSCFVDF